MTDREKFEVWVKENNSEWVRGVICALSAEGNYLSSKVQSAWEGWQAAIASQNEPGEGWIIWNGGDCPLACSAVIEAKFRDGVTQTGERADVYLWYHDGSGDDLVAYRVVKS